LGNPLDFILTPGQAHDLQGADALLPDMAAETLLADKAFDADERMITPARRTAALELAASAKARPSGRLILPAKRQPDQVD